MTSLTELNSEGAPDLERLLGNRELPTFRAAIVDALKKIRDLDTTPDEIAEAVQCNPQLVVRLLRTVNSAAFGLKRPIDDAAQAACYLGRSKLESLVLAIAVGESIPTPDDVPGFESRRFWAAAAQRATLGRRLAQELCPAHQSDCFTIGLLQDMAVPILAWSHPDEYGPVLEAWHADATASLSELERTAFGFSHGDVGRLLAEAWELPANLARAIGEHHAEEEEADAGFPAIHLVSLLRETELEAGVEALVEEAVTRFGLDPEWTVEAVIDASAQAAELTELFE